MRYVVTHPEATHHIERLVGGWYDSELTARGRADADRIAARLREMIPASDSVGLYTSDLRRTSQTAEPIARLFGLEPVMLPGLREKSYGVGHGRPQAWLDERLVLPPSTGNRLDHDDGIEGSETKREWVTRVYGAAEMIDADTAVHQIVVTHGGSKNWVIAAWLRLPIEACSYAGFSAPSGSISVLEEDRRSHNRWLKTLGDAGHLGSA